MSETIEVRGAREHNLRGVDLSLPRNRLIVFTGVSGSGKSSLAFDTLYVEGQRRYIESLSSYARQFLGQWRKPEFDDLRGLSPSISIEQKTGAANPRSTVGTVTEIHDYLRVLFARVGQGHCPSCERPIEAQSREQIVDHLIAAGGEGPITLLAPMARNQKGEFKDFFDDMLRRGFLRARVDGEIVRLADQQRLDRQMRHDIDVVVDRLDPTPANRARLAEAVEQALNLSDGSLVALTEDGTERLLSSRYACVACNRSFDPPSPQLFSFNSPAGMCRSCDGLGFQHTFDPDLLITDPEISIKEGAIALFGSFSEMGRWRRHILEGVAEHLEASLIDPWHTLSAAAKKGFLYGTGDQHIRFVWRSRGRRHYHGGVWEGVIPQLLSKYRKTSSPMHRAMYEKYMRVLHCDDCDGARLNEQARHVRVGGHSLIQWCGWPISRLLEFLDQELPKQWTPIKQAIGGEVIKEIRARVGFLVNVGLEYLSLDRPVPTLSGGEAQRIRLAGQIGSGLVGVLYVLDEPSIGLHPRDNARLLGTLAKLRDQGNTVLVVEHDEETIRAADYVVDFGPGPGVRGGEVVAQGGVQDIIASKESLTGQYLGGQRTIAVPNNRRPVTSSPEVSTPRKTVGSSKTATPSARKAGGKKKPAPRAVAKKTTVKNVEKKTTKKPRTPK